MTLKRIIAWGFLTGLLFLAAGLASCSNPDERPLDTFFPAFPNPLPRSPVGLVITDPAFRQVDPDPLIRENYLAADLVPMTASQLWAYFTNASQRIDIVGTRITNADFVARLVGIANRGVPVNIVCERGYFDDPESAPFVSQLSQTGNVTIKIDNDDIARQVHSNYAIIDDHIVLSSSGDFLDASFNTSVNNTLVLSAPRNYVNGSGAAGVKTVTDAFLFDFDQMFNQGRFGGDKERLVNHTFHVGVDVEVYFGPNDGLYGEIVEEINNADSSVYFAIRQLTDGRVVDILRALSQPPYNLAVLGYYDRPSNVDFTDILPDAVSFNWPGYNSLNHKFMLIDLPVDVTTTISPVILELVDPVVITGSNNWTASGLELNDEQMVIVHDLTLAFEFAVELNVLSREAAGMGVVFGTVRTNKNVPIEDASVLCDSESIPGGVFNGDGGESPEGQTNAYGNYALMVPSGFLRNIRVESLGDAGGLYLLPDPIWGEDMPNEGYNLLPGASYEANFYCSPAPSTTGTGGGGGGFGG